MGDSFIAFLIVLVVLAILTQETFVFVTLYLFAGASLLGRWWTGRLIKRVAFTRKFENKAFPGETVPVQVQVINQSLLPAVWMRVQDFYPLEVADQRSFHEVVSLGPRAETSLHYNLKAQKRGYYPVGPINISTGDILGLAPERTSEGAPDHLTVFPRVVPLGEIKLPSRSPMGSLRTRQPVYEDPSRPAGKREYRAGDSLRRIDWKASATTGRLQTKLFEPSIELETMLFLNLNAEDYPLRGRYDGTELAIVVAASLSNWVVSQRQAVGLVTNAVDPLAVDNQAIPIPARKGHPHLMRILELLARVRMLETSSFSNLVNQQRVRLNWGTTLVILTSGASQALFNELLQARRAGMTPVLILCGESSEHRGSIEMAKLYHIPVSEVRSEKDLDQWRKKR